MVPNVRWRRLWVRVAVWSAASGRSAAAAPCGLGWQRGCNLVQAPQVGAPLGAQSLRSDLAGTWEGGTSLSGPWEATASAQ